MAPRAARQVLLWSALLWAALGPPLVLTLLGLGMMLSGHAAGRFGVPPLIFIWPVFAPGAALCGAFCGGLILWLKHRGRDQVTLNRRGLAWEVGLGLLEFLWGFACLVILTDGEGPEQGWGEIGRALFVAPAHSPEILFVYATIAMSGAYLVWVVARWIVVVQQP